MKKITMLYYHIINKLFNPFHERVTFDNVTVDKDIIYDIDNPKICVADMYYLGEKTTKRPVFINIHGGGFVSGDKYNRRNFSGCMAEKGYFVYSPNYTLASEKPFPALTTDVINAINHLNTLKDEYNLDMDKVVLSGDSAGAYMAVQIYATIKNDEYRKILEMPKLDVDIKVLVPFCGPYDVLRFLGKPSPFGVNHTTAELITGMKLNRKCKNVVDFKYYDAMRVMDYINDKWQNVYVVYAKKDYFCAGSGESLCALFDELSIKYKSFHSKKLIDNHCFHLMLFTKISHRCLSEMNDYIYECFGN